MVTKCCCYYNLKAGGKIIAWLGIIGAVLYVIKESLLYYKKAEQEIKYDVTSIIVMCIAAIIELIINALLIFGINKVSS